MGETFVNGVKQQLKVDPIFPWTPVYVWIACGLIALSFGAGVFVGQTATEARAYQKGRLDEQYLAAARDCHIWVRAQEAGGRVSSESCELLTSEVWKR